MKLNLARETLRELNDAELTRLAKVAGAGTQQSICIGCGPSELNQCRTTTLLTCL
jgi:hypothetical protein